MPIKANIHDAKTNLSKLIKLAIEGEEVIIAKAGKPVAKLVPFVEKSKERKLGFLKGKIELRDDIDEPLPEKIIEEFYR
ncbi:MAG TPA: type II toxin-antitoxin system Phd/YefM family antitoxin [Deltaproteobacteria bacterium]|nr:type II toxin-antitoxin system Phd/YefM family antitoxin [Deltaproteobacteria bacterium]